MDTNYTYAYDPTRLPPFGATAWHVGNRIANKNTAKPFYERLIGLGYTDSFPWLEVALREVDDYHHVVARLAEGAPILASKRLAGFWYSRRWDGTAKVIEYLDDGSRVIEDTIKVGYFPSYAYMVYQIFAGGAVLEDGTTRMTIHADDLDENGEIKIRLIVPPGGHPCSRVYIYNSDVPVGVDCTNPNPCTDKWDCECLDDPTISLNDITWNPDNYTPNYDTVVCRNTETTAEVDPDVGNATVEIIDECGTVWTPEVEPDVETEWMVTGVDCVDGSGNVISGWTSGTKAVFTPIETGVGQITFKSVASVEGCSCAVVDDSITEDFAVVAVDLDIEGCEDSEEVTIGGFVPVNANNDNGSAINDYIPTTRDFDTNNYTDDDLVKISLTLLGPSGLSGTLKLSKAENGCDRIKIWETEGKVTPVSLPESWDVNTVSLPIELYLEGLKEGDDLRDIELLLEYDGNGVSCEDKVKVTVTPVLKTFEIEKKGFEPSLVDKRMSSSGFNWQLPPAAVEFTIEVHDIDNPAGDLKMIQIARLLNDPDPSGCGIDSYNGHDYNWVWKSPYTGQKLVDSEGAEPFYPDDATGSRSFEGDDTPNVYMFVPNVWPSENQQTEINFGIEFNCYAVWKFDDDTVYFLGNMNWETRYQGSLIGEEYGVVFIPGLFNANKCDSGFNRSNVEDKTEGPWANDVTTILEQIDP